ncbi:platelet-derived growth factor receptor-like protein [Hypomesus transpacificus]|uniref:platelet-derived growth factor receptor-like protein n=1 Tax=Hypomesus transpacificus TaxID=137520 RepID=UPI001F087CA9|nr:platelet-derived growth factor receptor-like protein [Hypomesus transpacificus]
MKLWLFLTLAVLWLELQDGAGQLAKRRKEAGENRIRPGGKRVKVRYPKLKDKDAGGKGQSLLTQVLDKGRFLRLGDSVSLTPGKTLELRCKGSNIGWGYPPYLDTFNDSRLSIKQSDKYSQLILTSPSAADTGTYSCWVILCDGSECHQDPDRISTSYIYFTDMDNLFVPSAIHFEIVYLRPDKPAIVPCRVTSPLAKVSLHLEVPPEEINGTLVTYDPTRGFILQNVGPEHQGVFYCKAVTKATPQVSTKYQLLYVEVPSGPPFVTLEPSSTSAREGDTINITCTVLGEPEVDVSFSWTHPGQERRPVDIQTSRRLINQGMGHTTRISHSVITIHDLETSDLGRYICRAKNPHGVTAVSTRISST